MCMCIFVYAYMYKYNGIIPFLLFISTQVITVVSSCVCLCNFFMNVKANVTCYFPFFFKSQESIQETFCFLVFQLCYYLLFYLFRTLRTILKKKSYCCPMSILLVDGLLVSKYFSRMHFLKWHN